MKTDYIKNEKITLGSVENFMKEGYYLVDLREATLRDHLDALSECLRNATSDELYDCINEMTEDCMIDNAEYYMDEIRTSMIDAGYEKESIMEFFIENRNEIMDMIYERDESNAIFDLSRSTGDIPIRIELFSDYDCINSHYTESYSGYSYEESYFGDMIDALNLNPCEVKKKLLSHGIKVIGKFPNKKNRNGNELIDYEGFYNELENTTCGANLLTFTAKVNLVQLLNKNFYIQKVTIPKGNFCGLYSSSQGGGSIFNAEIKEDFSICLNKKTTPCFNMVFDEGEGYSLKNTYGVYDSFFGENLKIN